MSNTKGCGCSGKSSSTDNPYVAKEAISSSWYPSYCPDTPLLEIGRKAAEERAEAMKYQHVWQQQRAEGQANQCCDLPPLENVLKNKLEPPPLPKEYLPEPDPWPQKVQQQQWCSPVAKFQCQNDPKNQTDQDIMPVKENCPPPSPPPESTSDNNCCSDEIKKDKSKEQCESRPPNPDCERLQEVAALCDQKLGLCKKEEEPRRPTACDFARQPMDTSIPPGPPNDRLCEKFMSFAQGTQPKMQLYDPANREFVEKNFQGLADRCQTLQSECFQNWDKKEKEAEGCNDEEESKTKAYKCCNLEPVGCEDRVKEVPPGCCDYRKLEGLSEEFIPPGFDICCPPMPENVPKLCMPGWMECPPEITVPPYPPPSGAKIKPISKGIRTNFERNPTCHKCGAKRKKPPKPECAMKNCPALKEPCSSLRPPACCGQTGNALMDQIKNLRKMIGF